jgi:hypothetical protein
VGLRDNHGLALEAPEPMPLAAMMALAGRGRRVALHQCVLGDDGRIGDPLIRAIELHIPWRQAINQRLQRRLVMPPTFPVQELPALTIQRVPDPPRLACLLEVVPQLLQLQDDGCSCGLWLLLVRLDTGSDPGAHGLDRDLEAACEAVHGDATQLPQDRVDLQRERLPAWRRAGQRHAAWLAELCGFPGDRAVVDEPITLALGTDRHRRPPPQTLASRSGGGV